MRQYKVDKFDRVNGSFKYGGRQVSTHAAPATMEMIDIIRWYATPRTISVADAIRLAIRVLAESLKAEMDPETLRLVEERAAEYAQLREQEIRPGEPRDEGEPLPPRFPKMPARDPVEESGL